MGRCSSSWAYIAGGPWWGSSSSWFPKALSVCLLHKEAESLLWWCNYCPVFSIQPNLLTDIICSAAGPRYGALQMFAWPNIFKQEGGVMWRIFKLN